MAARVSKAVDAIEERVVGAGVHALIGNAEAEIFHAIGRGIESHPVSAGISFFSGEAGVIPPVAAVGAEVNAVIFALAELGVNFRLRTAPEVGFATKLR